MKFKNIILLVFILLLSICIVGCKKDDGKDVNDDPTGGDISGDNNPSNNDPSVSEPVIYKFKVITDDYPKQVEITKKDTTDSTYYINEYQKMHAFFDLLNEIQYKEIKEDDLCGENTYIIKYGDVVIEVYTMCFKIGDKYYSIYSGSKGNFEYLKNYNSENTDTKLSDSTGWLPWV